jgi:hypothetical protein
MKIYNKLNKGIPKNMCTCFFIAIVEKHIALFSLYSPSTPKIRIKKNRPGKGRRRKKKEEEKENKVGRLNTLPPRLGKRMIK